MSANKEIHTDKRNFIMATYQNSNVQPFGANLFAAVTNVLENITANLAAKKQARITKMELLNLSARELADIGMTRGDINNV